MTKADEDNEPGREQFGGNKAKLSTHHDETPLS